MEQAGRPDENDSYRFAETTRRLVLFLDGTELTNVLDAVNLYYIDIICIKL